MQSSCPQLTTCMPLQIEIIIIIIKGMFSQQMSNSINNNNIINKHQVVHILYFSYFAIVMFLGSSLTISSLQNVKHSPFASSTKTT